MKYISLTENDGLLKQNIMLNKEEIEIVNYIENIRVIEKLDNNGNFLGVSINYVVYDEKYKIIKKLDL